MRPSLLQVQQHGQQLTPALLPVALLATASLSPTATPFRHSLFVNSVAWLLVCAYHGARLGVKAGAGSVRKRRLNWLAGLLFALAQMCDRAAADIEGMWWAKALQPLAVYLLLRCFFERDETTLATQKIPVTLDKIKNAGVGRLLLVVTGTSLVILSSAFVRLPISTLGICGTLLSASALVILEYNLRGHQEEKPSSPGSQTNGFFLQAPLAREGSDEEAWTAFRDMAAVVAVVCMFTSFSFESFRTLHWTYRVPEGVSGNDATPKKVKIFSYEWNAKDDFLGIIIECAKVALALSLIRRHGSFEVSIILLGAVIIKRISFHCTLSEVWLALLFAGASMLLFDDAQSLAIFTSSRRRTKTRQLVTLLAAASLAFVGIKALTPFSHRPVEVVAFPVEPPLDTFGPLKISDTKSHPIDQLIRSSESEFSSLLSRQSKTLEEAVAEYRRRYGIPPPPNFDIWFEFAKRKNVQLIDEYDAIHETLLPFWALEPSVIRARVAEAIGFDNVLLAVLIRGGEAVKAEGGPEWQQEATVGMMKEFIQHLPDMDLAFNLHDEPRVILPADQLAQLVHRAKTQRLPAALTHKKPRNAFSARPADLDNGKRIKEVKTTRFNRFAHQHTWSHSRASCDPAAPARDFEEISKDNVTSYAYGELGFVYNSTAFSDICMSPSLRETFGFFDRPNAFNIVQDLFPIFSQSKISSFQDILYPSPWYWAQRVGYDKKRDVPWEQKDSRLYWRGSTTGGFSRNGGWRRQHRQRVVRRLNALDTARILVNQGEGDASNWQVQDVSRKDYESIIDVKFSHIGQCDPSDCEAQTEFFNVVEKADQQDAWKYKYLLDMDGNAFSGRFYAFLQSNSLVYKMSVFQEWHREWVKSWVHYIPLSLRGDEWLEATRYFGKEKEGEAQARRLASKGQEWAQKALRNEDFEVWFFRLLLEYGRLVDDNRETIGYSAP